MNMTENEIVAMVIEDARARPLSFIDVLARCLLRRDDGVEVLAEALHIMGEAYLAEAEALRRDNGKSAEICDFRGATRAQTEKPLTLKN